MKRVKLLVAAMWASSTLSCSFAAQPAQPTLIAATQPAATPLPTLGLSVSPTPPAPATETPTATLEPAATAPPSPTAAVAATPDPSNGVGAEVFSDAFTGQTGYFWTYSDDVADFAAGSGQLVVSTKGGNTSWRYVVRPDLNIGDQQVRVTARLAQCGPDGEYGLMFRVNHDPAGHRAYLFKLNCRGEARFERLEGADITVLADWTASPAIVPGAPAENVLMVWAARDQFHFYVNERHVISASDGALASGFYGFYIRDRDGTGESLSFTALVARAVTPP